MIKLEKISKKFNDKYILEDINYTFKSGIYQIEGINGSGKTTLLKCICGLEEYSGVISINNHNNLNSEELLSTYISYVRQDISLFQELTVKQNIELILSEENNQRLSELITTFEFDYCLEKVVSSLSSGEQKITEFIIAVARLKPILILDEIDNFLDDVSKARVVKELEKYDGVVLLTSHTKLIDNAIIVDIKDMNEQENEGFSPIDNVYKSSRKTKDVNFKIAKSKYLLIFIILAVVLSVGVGYLIMRKADQYNSGLSNDVQQFYDDTAILITPPYMNPEQYEYQTSAWYDKTPYLLPESLLDELKQLPYVTDARGIGDRSTSTSIIVDDGIDYYTQGSVVMSPYPYDISKELNLQFIFPEYLEGDLPKDDSFEVVASETFMNDNDLNIGDTISIEGIGPSNESRLFDYTIVGINHSRGDDLVVSYQTDNGIDDAYDPNTNTGRKVSVQSVQANSLSPIKLDDIDPSDVYYPSIYLKTDNVKDTKKLIKYIQDYDPYIGIESNFQYSSSLIYKYEKEKDLHLFSKIIVIYFIVIVGTGTLLLMLEIKRMNENILKPLHNYGFTIEEIKLIYKKVTNKYIYTLLAIATFMLLLVIIFGILLAKLMFISSLLILLLMMIVINLILKKEVYEIKS